MSIPKELESARLRSMIEQMPVMVALLRPDGFVEMVNRHWERTLGWTFEEARQLDVVAALTPSPEECAEARAFADAAPPNWRDARVVRRDGSLVHTSWAVVKLPDGVRLCVGFDITARKRTEESLRRTHEQLRLLSQRVARATEDERTSVARELHDELGQQLTALKMDLDWVQRHLPVGQDGAGMPALRAKVLTMEAAVDETLGAIRRIAAGLRPIALERLGLIDALEGQAQQFERRGAIRCRFVRHVNAFDIGVDRATHVIRIVQEALTNTVRHAHASRVTVKAGLEGQDLSVEVRDNGRGIPDEAIDDARSLGLLGMRERASLAGGALSVGRARGRGTVVVLRIPRDGSGA